MGLKQTLDGVFRGRNEQLSWGWLEDDHLGAEIDTSPFTPNQVYFRVRLSEMFLRNKRTLWREFYPMVHAFVEHDGQEIATVAGPGQLRDLGSANLDKFIGLAFPLCPVTVYRDKDIAVLTGLYSVGSRDMAKVLLGSLGELSKLVGVAAESALKIADVVKTGVEGILQIDGTVLQLGARDAFVSGATAGKRARAGCLVAIDAPAREIDFKTLWVRDGRLYSGPDAQRAQPYEEHDYMLIEIERKEQREDWRSLPEVKKYEEPIDEILRSDQSLAQKKAALNALWRKLQTEVERSPNLTRGDAKRVLGSLLEGVQARLQAGDGPFGAEAAALDVMRAAARPTPMRAGANKAAEAPAKKGTKKPAKKAAKKAPAGARKPASFRLAKVRDIAAGATGREMAKLPRTPREPF